MVRMASWVLARLGGDSGRIGSLPMSGGWTATRDLPAPSGPTFKERWAKQRH
jgi:L-lactate dehydrogenase complex protein LldF